MLFRLRFRVKNHLTCCSVTPYTRLRRKKHFVSWRSEHGVAVLNQDGVGWRWCPRCRKSLKYLNVVSRVAYSYEMQPGFGNQCGVWKIINFSSFPECCYLTHRQMHVVWMSPKTSRFCDYLIDLWLRFESRMTFLHNLVFCGYLWLTAPYFIWCIHCGSSKDTFISIIQISSLSFVSFFSFHKGLGNDTCLCSVS